MIKWLIIIAAVIGLLVSCHDSAGNNPNNPNEPNNPQYPNNPQFNATIVFNNTQGICAVSVYDDYRRRDEDKIVEVPACQQSAGIEWTPGESVPFYFSYRVNIKGISGFSLNYVPEIGRDQKAVRIDADKTTTIIIPTLSESISSPDTLFSNNSYLFIQNNSIYSFELLRGNSKIKADNISSSLVNDGEKAQYMINPGQVSNYRLLVGADYKEFPDSIVNFEAGHIYIFDYNSTISLVNNIELKLENVNGFIIPQPPVAPTVITSNGSITLRWTAVESAMAYEIWTATVNDSASATKYGTDVASSLTATINGLNNGTTYYFWLKAKNSMGTSGFSPVAIGIPSAATAKPPDPQTAPSIIAGNGQLSVSWQAVEDASDYEVWAGTTNNTQSATKRGEDVLGLSAVITGLNNGTSYYVWIKAKNNIGVSGFSPSSTGKPLGTPGTPTVNSGSEQLLVTWADVAGAEEYEVYYGIGTPTTLAETTAVTTVTINGLTGGTTYNVHLRAKNANGVSDYGPSASGVPIGKTGAVTVSSGDGQLSLSWASIDGADQYEVYYSTSNSIPASPVQIITTTTATISGLTNGTTYYIWVKAKNASGANNTSTVVSGKPLGTPGIPTVNSTYKGLLITWTPVAGAEQYEVYYGIGTATTLATTTAGTTATISGLTVGMTYYVRLRAKNANGTSDYGATASGLPNNNISAGLYRGNQKVGNQNLADSLTYISSNAVTGDDFLIVLGANESVSPKTLSYSNKTVRITLLGTGIERTLTLNTNGSMFTVNSGVTLTIDENITLVGRSTNTEGLVSIVEGNLIMNNGSKINGNTNTSSSYDGGGVLVDSGIFTMNGGEITDNVAPHGGGVYLYNGSFTMNGGKIKGNNARGGGIFIYSGTVILNSGTISGNISDSIGGGIEVSNGVFTMYGGIISGNSASSYGGGIYASGTFKKLPPSGGQNSGIIYGSEAIGVDVDGVPLKNTSNNNKGHAVFGPLSQYRNSTAGETDQIDTNTGKGLSINGNPPYGQ